MWIEQVSVEKIRLFYEEQRVLVHTLQRGNESSETSYTAYPHELGKTDPHTSA